MAQNNKFKNGLAGIIAASVLSGCVTMAPQRTNIYGANNFQGTSGEYFAATSQIETGKDAAETNREARCLYAFNGRTYHSKDAVYKDLSKCVGEERAKDMATYLPLAVLLDGLKVYALFSGTKSATNSLSGNNNSNVTVGRGSVTRTIGDVTR